MKKEKVFNLKDVLTKIGDYKREKFNSDFDNVKKDWIEPYLSKVLREQADSIKLDVNDCDIKKSRQSTKRIKK